MFEEANPGLVQSSLRSTPVSCVAIVSVLTGACEDHMFLARLRW